MAVGGELLDSGVERGTGLRTDLGPEGVVRLRSRGPAHRPAAAIMEAVASALAMRTVWPKPSVV